MHLHSQGPKDAPGPEPDPPPPPSAYVARGSAQCHGMGCSARTGIACAYVDRRGRACPTAWCPSHRSVVDDTVYCSLHAATLSAMRSEYGDTAHPDLDNRLPAMIAWISQAAEDDIVAILQGICRDRDEVLVSDPVRRVLLGTRRQPTWERAWKTCSAVGVGARVAIAVEEAQPSDVLIKVNTQVIARLTAPADHLGVEPAPEVVELLVRQMVLLITMYLNNWQEEMEAEQQPEATELKGERAPKPIAGRAQAKKRSRASRS
jgi:hypothetical protein